MTHRMLRFGKPTGLAAGVAIAGALTAALAPVHAVAQPRDLGDGFKEHGLFANVATSRGAVATVDGDGNNVLLIWLTASGYLTLSVIDAETGEVEEIPDPGRGDSPFGSLFSSQGRYYTYAGGHFMEFDPETRAFTFVQQGPERFGRAWIEDDDGVIWTALNPDAHVISFNPHTRELREYGPINEHDSPQFPSHGAADDQGWVYFTIGLTVGQIFMLEPESGEVTPVLPEDKAVGSAGEGSSRVRVFRDRNGKVYGFAPYGDQGRRWFELHDGEATMLDSPPNLDREPTITGTQGLRHFDWPDGQRITELDVPEGVMVVEDSDGNAREVTFEISGGGSLAMQVHVTPDDAIGGGTYHPKRFFRYDPQTHQWTRRALYGQWNALATAAERIFIASYTEGVILEWDPAQPWVPTDPDDPKTNPRYLAQTRSPDIGRPNTLLAHPDGRHVIMGGSPSYGGTGAGLVIYDTQSEDARILEHEQLLPYHSTSTLTALPDGRLVGGTSVRPGGGGVQQAEAPELYILDLESGEIEWHDAPIDDAERYTDMITGPNGEVIGVLDRTVLFVFDPQQHEIVHKKDLREILRHEDLEEQYGQTVFDQGPRVFVPVPDGRIFILLRQPGPDPDDWRVDARGLIAELDLSTYEIIPRAEAPAFFTGGAPEGLPEDVHEASPTNFGNGGAYLDGRIYLSGGPYRYWNHLISWEVPPADE